MFQALRIALQCIESHCNRYGRYIVPFVSLSVDFYIRIFVQIWTSPQVVKKSARHVSGIWDHQTQIFQLFQFFIARCRWFINVPIAKHLILNHWANARKIRKGQYTLSSFANWLILFVFQALFLLSIFWSFCHSKMFKLRRSS